MGDSMGASSGDCDVHNRTCAVGRLSSCPVRCGRSLHRLQAPYARASAQPCSSYIGAVWRPYNWTSRGFGFCTFALEEAVDSVFAMGVYHELDEKRIQCKRATPSRDGRDGAGGGGRVRHAPALVLRSLTSYVTPDTTVAYCVLVPTAAYPPDTTEAYAL